MKKLTGVVVGTKMTKTAVVEVEKDKVHPLYKKRTRRRKKYHAHDEIGVRQGQRVVIQECRPISKTKRWKIKEVIK
jgi:small subunit ribosomal protein S17